MSPTPPPPAQDSLAPLGLDAIPDRPPRETVQANTAALATHRAGDWASSAAGFREALRLAPAYDIARFNLACALSRLGELDAAARELETLLARDLPRFRALFERDPDLEALRAPPRGAAIRESIAELEGRWTAALRAGVPAVAWQPGRDQEPGSGDSARPGAWIPSLRRFLPAVPPVDGAFSALTDLEAGKAIVVAGRPGCPGLCFIEGASVRVATLWPAAAPVVVATDQEAAFVEAYATTGGACVRIVGAGATGWECSDGARPPASPSRPWIHVDPDGTLLSVPPPPGFGLRGTRLEIPAGPPIELGSGHAASQTHSVLVSPGGDIAIVASVRTSCDDDTGGLRHFVDRVSLATRAVERLSFGPGAAAVRFDGTGALYLQLGETVRRYPTSAATSCETLPPRVLLVPPMTDPDCGL